MIFIFFCYRERAHDKKRVQSQKFKTLSRIPNHDLLSQTLNNIYLSTLPAKINDKFSQNKGKTLFWGHFLLRKFFLRTLAKYNPSGPPAFQCKKYRVDWLSSQKLFACKNLSMNLLNSLNHLWDKPNLRVPWSIRPHLFFTQLIIIKLT